MFVLNKSIAAGIGLASETIHSHRDKKRAKRTPSEETENLSLAPVSSLVELVSHPVADPETNALDLDEAQEHINKPRLDRKKMGFADCDKLAQGFASSHPSPCLPDGAGRRPLDCAIILPQRRPNTRARGFIQAYAPILKTRGIDQETFLDFVEMFNYASQAAPWLDAINLAAIATIPLAPAIGMAVSVALRVGIDVSKEMISRQRTSKFLDGMNRYYFKPRGLYCMVMTWKPQSSNFSTTVNIEKTVEKIEETAESGSRSFRNRYASSSGSTYGNLNFPECAPLVFPRLDDVDMSTLKEETPGFRETVADYQDRRARAKFAMKNPNSQLAGIGQPAQFKSRYADPSHPAARGSLIGLLTGGAVTFGDGLVASTKHTLEHGRSPLQPGTQSLPSGSSGPFKGLIGGTLFEKSNADLREDHDQKNGKYSGQYSNMYKEIADASEKAASGSPSTDMLGAIHPGSLLKMVTGRQTLYLTVVDLPSKEEFQKATKIISEADPRLANVYKDVDIDSILYESR